MGDVRSNQGSGHPLKVDLARFPGGPDVGSERERNQERLWGLWWSKWKGDAEEPVRGAGLRDEVRRKAGMDASSVSKMRGCLRRWAHQSAGWGRPAGRR